MGILIAVEGIDGAGKTTQVQLLRNALEIAGEDVVVSREPTDGQWGRQIRESAQNGRMEADRELHAFIEDRKEHISHTIAPALAKNQIVILDRYFYSTIAYQGARGNSKEDLLSNMKVLAPIPDLAFVLDVEPAVAISRIANDRGDIPNEFERFDYLVDVREVFQWLAASEKEVRELDGHRPIADIHKEIVDILVDGPFSKYKAKPYECDCWYCLHREVGSCRWLTLRQSLRTGVGTG